jgi:6-phosphogluconolactonase
MTTAASNREIVVCHDPAALAEQAADRIIAAASESIAARGQFTLALSGGSTPERLYKLLAAERRRTKIDWQRTWLSFGDERFVPHTNERSNYRVAAEALLKPAQIPSDHVFAVPVDCPTPADAAAEYEKQLRAFFGESAANQFPQFDLILLGLGDDGHTASLFPGKPALNEKTAWVTWSPPGALPPPVDRVTFTFPVLNAARQVMFLVAGTGKSQIVREILENSPNPQRHPASGVKPQHGKLVWMLDEAAASALTRKPPTSYA